MIEVLLQYTRNAWQAIAIDFSLIGEGISKEAALQDLEEMFVAQISYALENDLVDNIFKSAEVGYVEAYREAKRRALREKILGTVGQKVESNPREAVASLNLETIMTDVAVSLAVSGGWFDEAAEKAQAEHAI